MLIPHPNRRILNSYPCPYTTHDAFPKPLYTLALNSIYADFCVKISKNIDRCTAITVQRQRTTVEISESIKNQYNYHYYLNAIISQTIGLDTDEKNTHLSPTVSMDIENHTMLIPIECMSTMPSLLHCTRT